MKPKFPSRTLSLRNHRNVTRKSRVYSIALSFSLSCDNNNNTNNSHLITLFLIIVYIHLLIIVGDNVIDDDKNNHNNHHINKDTIYSCIDGFRFFENALHMFCILLQIVPVHIRSNVTCFHVCLLPIGTKSCTKHHEAHPTCVNNIDHHFINVNIYGHV